MDWVPTSDLGSNMPEENIHLILFVNKDSYMHDMAMKVWQLMKGSKAMLVSKVVMLL